MEKPGMDHKPRFPAAIRVVFAVARVTFKEIVRDRLLYNILVFSVLLFSVGVLASRAAVVMSAERVILDFGLTALRLSGSMIGIFVGSALLIREVDRRTIHVALSHPITRAQFVFGKYLGLATVLLLNWILSTGAYILLLIGFNDWNFSFTATFGWAVFFAGLEGLFMASAAVFFSTFTTTSLSVIFCIGLYLIGNNISAMRTLAVKSAGSFQGVILDALSRALPNLEHFNLGTKLTYSLTIPGAFLTYGVLYGVALILLFLWAAGLLLGLKEI